MRKCLLEMFKIMLSELLFTLYIKVLITKDVHNEKLNTSTMYSDVKDSGVIEIVQ